MKFIDPSGKEQTVEGIADYLKAVESGQLQADSMVFDGALGKWVRAAETAEYRSLASRKSVRSAETELKRARQFRIGGWTLIFLGPLSATVISSAFDGALIAGERLGEALFVLLLLAVPLYFAFRRSSDLRKAMATAAVGGCLTMWMAIGTYQGWLAAQEGPELRSVAASVSEQMQSGRPATSGTVANSGNPPSSAVARFLASVPQRMARNEAEARAFQESAAALHLEEVLAPRALITARGIDQGRETLRRYEELVDTYVRANRRYVESLTAEVTEMNLSPAQRAEFNAGYARGLARSGELLGGWAQLQTKQAAKTRELLDLASSLSGTLAVKDGTLMFTVQRDLNTYNRLLAELQVLAEQETALSQEQAKRASDMQEQIRELGVER